MEGGGGWLRGAGRRWRVDESGCRDAQASAACSVQRVGAGRGTCSSWLGLGLGLAYLLQLLHHDLDRQCIPATPSHAALCQRRTDCAWCQRGPRERQRGWRGAGAGARQLSARSSASTAGSSLSPSAKASCSGAGTGTSKPSASASASMSIDRRFTHKKWSDEESRGSQSLVRSVPSYCDRWRFLPVASLSRSLP